MSYINYCEFLEPKINGGLTHLKGLQTIFNVYTINSLRIINPFGDIKYMNINTNNWWKKLNTDETQIADK